MPAENNATGQRPDVNTMRAALGAMAEDVMGHLIKNFGLVVENGPFAGMQYVEYSSGSNFAPKLLGSYESNLHGLIEEIVGRDPRQIVNIGCGEGYYAVGFARRLPHTQIHAFDLDAQALLFCRTMAKKNGVEQRLVFVGACTVEDLRRLCPSHPVIFCDCEGAEIDLLDPAKVPDLAHCEIVVELHDFVNPAITPTLTERFRPTHAVNVMLDTGRNPNAYPALRNIPEVYQLLAICESRPLSMSWAHLKPKS